MAEANLMHQQSQYIVLKLSRNIVEFVLHGTGFGLQTLQPWDTHHKISAIHWKSDGHIHTLLHLC